MLKPLKIKQLVFNIPIIQGGMGVGISRHKLASAVSREGGLGVISTAQIGYDEPEFMKDPINTNLKAIKKHVTLAKKEAGGAPIGVNIMVATKEYEKYVIASVEAGVDVIISGAGLPVDLPAYVKGSEAVIAPIVSSEKACHVILKLWDRKYKRTADFIVIEGPKAGGHLGFSREELAHIEDLDYDAEIKKIIECVHIYEEKYKQKIPVIVAGGIFDKQDIAHAMELGADGVQIASRFVATRECDASEAFKQAYVAAKEEDIVIVDSPVGMPGRAIRNKFIEEHKGKRDKITKCHRCLQGCDPSKIPYCITKALTNAAEGNLEEALIFVGANVGRIKSIMSVHELILELTV